MLWIHVLLCKPPVITAGCYTCKADLHKCLKYYISLIFSCKGYISEECFHQICCCMLGDLHQCTDWYKREMVYSLCVKISLYSPAGKMVFTLSGSCWLDRKKRENYFKDDTAAGERLFCLLSHTITFCCVLYVRDLLCVFISKLLGWNEISQSPFWFILQFVTKAFFISVQPQVI